MATVCRHLNPESKKKILILISPHSGSWCNSSRTKCVLSFSKGDPRMATASPVSARTIDCWRCLYHHHRDSFPRIRLWGYSPPPTPSQSPHTPSDLALTSTVTNTMQIFFMLLFKVIIYLLLNTEKSPKMQEGQTKAAFTDRIAHIEINTRGRNTVRSYMSVRM